MKKFIIAIILGFISFSACTNKVNKPLYGDTLVLPIAELNINIHKGDDILNTINELKNTYNLTNHSDSKHLWSNDGKWDYRTDTLFVSETIAISGNELFSGYYEIVFNSNNINELTNIYNTIINSYKNSDNFIEVQPDKYDYFYEDNLIKFHGLNYNIKIYNIQPFINYDIFEENGIEYYTGCIYPNYPNNDSKIFLKGTFNIEIEYNN